MLLRGVGRVTGGAGGMGTRWVRVCDLVRIGGPVRVDVGWCRGPGRTDADGIRGCGASLEGYS
ncbi:hypothetical protein SGM_1332 [Streptomyces griseoaurantiacus M045]|uniref:Uncharacterized protein n=1 Tax=Streptomyces griseoaurantiacus M045 TaxID=996637 RepID=F3NDW8_9ACTN|nr:hypothetical protein SGM_1332 [Streptomyces griseoaurantiacus M045]